MNDWTKPTTTELNRAIEVYLQHAYGGSPIPAAVRKRLESLSAFPEPLAASCIERDEGETPKWFKIRLGNQVYPHMKLIVERAPDGVGRLYRADTHDSHVQPSPDSREYPAFRELMLKNRSIAAAIQAAWEDESLPTFKSYLRADLAKRSAKAADSGDDVRQP